MNLDVLVAILIAKDKLCKKYRWNGEGDEYTIYTPHTPIDQRADDVVDDGTIAVTIERYARSPDDALIFEIYNELLDRHITCEPPFIDLSLLDEQGYYRFILECLVFRR